MRLGEGHSWRCVPPKTGRSENDYADLSRVQRSQVRLPGRSFRKTVLLGAREVMSAMAMIASTGSHPAREKCLTPPTVSQRRYFTTWRFVYQRRKAEFRRSEAKASNSSRPGRRHLLAFSAHPHANALTPPRSRLMRLPSGFQSHKSARAAASRRSDR